MFRFVTGVLVLWVGWVGVGSTSLHAEETKQSAGSVQISFLPPPLEKATYSLGIFDAKTGKLVRQLQTAALEKDFTAGLNGLVTAWDGKDDAGKPALPGHYAANGYAVGPFKVEGVDVLGNDWAADDEALRMSYVSNIAFVPEDGGVVVFGGNHLFELQVARYGGGEKTPLLWRRTAEGTRILVGSPAPKCGLAVEAGMVIANEVAAEGSVHLAYHLADGKDATPTAGAERKPTTSEQCEGKDGTLWKIEDGVLSQYSAGGERLRSLPWKEGEPTPKAVTASKTADQLYLLEDMKGMQRVRGLSWKETSKEGDKLVSTWTTFFERKILHSPLLDLKNLVDAPVSFNLEVPLVDNPLSPGRAERLKLAVVGGPLAATGVSGEGGYLATADGLRLRRISQRPGVITGDLARGKTADSILFFQYDGVAWDEFSIKGIRNIMAFDAGEFELTTNGEKPADPKSAEPPDL